MDAESCHSALIGKHLEGTILWVSLFPLFKMPKITVFIPGHQLKHPNVTMGGPKSERLLGLTMGWLLEAALYSHHSEEKPRGDVCDGQSVLLPELKSRSESNRSTFSAAAVAPCDTVGVSFPESRRLQVVDRPAEYCLCS